MSVQEETTTTRPDTALSTTTGPPTPERSARTSLARTRNRAAWLFASPALLVILLVTVFPVIYSVVLSFARVTIDYDGFQVEEYTLANYGALLQSQDWYRALGFTILYTVVTVTIELVLGMLSALVLERLGVTRGWMLALLLIPWSLVTIVSAQLWKYIYDSTYGIATWGIALVTDSPPVILGEPVSAAAALMVADIWKTTPFVAIILLAGLVMIPDEQYEAAELDGSSAWSTFWRVVMPQLLPTFTIAVLFRVLQAFGVFDLPFVLTQGGPGTSTQTLAIMGYKVLFQDINIGPGAAIATSTALIVGLGCLLFLRAFRNQAKGGD
ncbi:sugar ABC transporter permease [uncultured Frigoribacterium sp.]|jgi:multiple sugar transport system permease protein|uniref:carbohydrate ABC transporter permease n=1 Tax=uncultured Frigoribacterium sp. TaxID=335377 RepID=UPI0028D415CC|nr:sugar ABC transporter permease [uncultured Frigoribacterium sp.]